MIRLPDVLTLRIEGPQEIADSDHGQLYRLQDCIWFPGLGLPANLQSPSSIARVAETFQISLLGLMSLGEATSCSGSVHGIPSDGGATKTGHQAIRDNSSQNLWGTVCTRNWLYGLFEDTTVVLLYKRVGGEERIAIFLLDMPTADNELVHHPTKLALSKTRCTLELARNRDIIIWFAQLFCT